MARPLVHRRFWLTPYKASVNGRVFYEVAHPLDSSKCSRRIPISHCLASIVVAIVAGCNAERIACRQKSNLA
jgi:hypothetical protein